MACPLLYLSYQYSGMKEDINRARKAAKEAMIFDQGHLNKIEGQRRESPEVERLIAQRDKLLSDHPHLRELQEEVDVLLSTTIDPVMRLEILFMLMTDRLMELRAVFTELMKLARTAVAEE